MKVKLRDIPILGMLIALSIILTRFASVRIPIGGIEGIRIGFGTLPIILGGIFFGPWLGMMVGAFADVVGFILSPLGPYMPHFTLTSALYGAIPGMIVHAFSFSTVEKRIVLGITIAQVGVGGMLTPYFLHTIFGMPWQLLIIPRLFTVPINIALSSLLCLSLHRVFASSFTAKKESL